MLALVTRGSGPVEMDLGAGRFAAHERPGCMNIAPPHLPCVFDVGHEFDLLICGLPDQMMAEAASDLGLGHDERPGRLHETLFRDPLIEELLRRIDQETRYGATVDALFIDQAARMLAAALFRAAQTTPTTRVAARALSHRMLAEVREHIEASLDERLTLTRLARICGMEPYRFTRAFKDATGVTPYQYTLEARINRAKTLLSDGDASIAEIAFSCGFSSQSHLTSTFSKRVGVAPGSYRRSTRR